ncbi:MAG: carbohydrate kinase family protein [Pseudomonadota bacterium]
MHTNRTSCRLSAISSQPGVRRSGIHQGDNPQSEIRHAAGKFDGIRNPQSFDVVGFGALNLDYIYSIEDLSILGPLMDISPGQELFLPNRLFEETKAFLEQHARLMNTSGGGSAANTVFALGRMGFKTGYIGKVGKDKAGDFLVKSLPNVDCSHVQRQGKTGACISVIDRHKDRSILLFPNTNNTASVRKKDMEAVTRAQFAHFSSFAGDKPFVAQVRMAQALGPGVRLSLDPGQLYAEKGLSAILPLVGRCFILFVTETEVQILTGKDYHAGSRELLEPGPAIVACKRGGKGSFVLSRDEELEIPAESVEVVDNTGAGDVYDAAFLAGLLMERPLRDCALFATKMAARSITGPGRSRYPTRKDLSELRIANCGLRN